ncbi:hypothetical protein [Streptomyces sp. NBC_00091]|uniref:hypothetical protein n=1 Tax=Streptomyces sp. NBC_00091 TaxID=2975648 RepID=UPI002B1E5438|nr:hypothetical protein [Streptomyces sp. NBC_00091]
MTSNPSTPDTDGPKTETTLTTRIRINIPGSRPIPPVVVRKPVKDAAQNASPAAAEPAPAETLRASVPARTAPPVRPAGQAPALAPAPAAPAPEPAQAPADEPASNWFAPRKAAAPPPAVTPPAVTPPPPAPAAPGASYGSAAPTGAGAGFAPPAAPGRPQPPAAPGRPQPPAAHGSGAGFAPAPAVGGPGVGAPQGYAGYDGGPVTEPFPAFPEPAGPTGGPALGTVPVGAEEAPRWPGPEALDVPAPGPGRVPGPVPGPGPAAPPPGPQPPRQTRPAPAQAGKSGKGAKPGKPAKKGRSKLVLLGGGIVVLAGVAYGAGLLMNHSDVPKGTTVLGVDISGSRDDAVTKLQTAFGKRASAPLQLSVGGKTVELKPEKAGLTLDSQTTVRNATGSDYNPVTVIGSLFGVERAASAVMPVDEEKLRVSLQELGGAAGSASEGTIKFDTGKAVAVPGKAGTTLDVDGSVDKVTKAFRELVANGKAPTVELPTATKEPTVTQTELDRAMKEFAQPAMSGNATVTAGGKSLAFGAKSLPKILSMTAVEGRLVEKYDLEALKATYGNTFDGVLITRGTGAKTPVTPQDVAGALGKALLGKTPAERTGTIDTNAN